MEKKLDGYVIYGVNKEKQPPLGVVSDNHECKADAYYIPTRLKDYLIQIEDKRFYEHNGIDLKGITRALIENLKAGRIIQGGSTITQQLARNILNDNSKSILRKLRETKKALNLELRYTKDEILNLYFNNVYFGKNLRGIRTASLCYFEKEIEQLSQSEFLYLLTILRGPNYYINNLDKAKNRYFFLSEMLFRKQVISKNRYKKNIQTNIVLKNNHLQMISSNVVPYIIRSINDKMRTISSTINPKTQDFVIQIVKESKYPVSIIAIQNNDVIAFASSYGTDYPFTSRANVGSTLKPFLYCYLRDGGISSSEEFDALENSLNWSVREVACSKNHLNLQEALMCSNNNVFINASNKLGIKNSMQFLADLFNLELTNFYPASILGATKSGISLYELGLAYNSFFNYRNLTTTQKECLSTLAGVFKEKLGFVAQGAYLKTGTTNKNKERYAILGNPNVTFAVLRNENPINETSKEGSFLGYTANKFSPFFNPQHNYKWI
ncbi:MAG: penicillin-binding protein [Odoribacteraceae bacterium]|jgi:penicillin-binding protein 1A|nr:penicillin-binding protein [Odoribacteraceae bacterium]